MKTVTSLTRDGNYVANEQLYEEWGIEPAHSLISLERQTAQDFEQRPDSIVKDVATGVALLANASPNSINELDDFCYFETSVEKKLLFEGLNECKATVVVWLGREDSDQLVQFITSKVKEFELNPDTRFSDYLFFVHRSDFQGGNNLAGRIDEQLKEINSDYIGLEQSVGMKSSPVSFCRVELSLDEIIELRYLSRDSQRETVLSSSRFKAGTKEHGNRIFKNFPRLTTEMFDSSVLPNLIRRSFIPSSTEDLAKETDSSTAKTKPILVALEKAGVVQIVNGDWAWHPTLDGLLETIGNETDLAKSFFLTKAEQSKIQRSIVECYGNNLVKEEDQNLVGVSLAPYLVQRAQALSSLFDEELQKLKAKSVEDANSINTEIRTRLESEKSPEIVHELLIKIVGEIEKLNRLAGEVESRWKIQLKALTDLRKKLDESNCEFDEELTKKKSELLILKNPQLAPDIKALKEQFELCINAHSRALKERENAELLRKECLAQLDQEKKEISKISKAAKGVSFEEEVAPQIQIVAEAEGEFREQLNQCRDGLPNLPTSAILANLETISEGVGKLGAKSQGIQSSIERKSNSKNKRETKPETELEFEDLSIAYGEEGIQILTDILKSGRRIKSLEVKLPE